MIYFGLTYSVDIIVRGTTEIDDFVSRTNNVSSNLTIFLNVRNTFIGWLSTEVVSETGVTMDMLLSEFTHCGRVKVTYFCGAKTLTCINKWSVVENKLFRAKNPAHDGNVPYQWRNGGHGP